MKIERKIPILNDGWVIKGTQEIPRLVNVKTTAIIKLTDETLDYILMCDGTNDYSDIRKKYPQYDYETIDDFYKQFEDENVISFINEKIPKIDIDIAMGTKEPWLKEVHLDITNNCNLRCRHCFWGENLKQEKNIPYQQWKQAISDMRNAGVAKIVLSGGEALTYDELYSIVTHIYDCKIMLASIFTNGTIYNEQFKDILDFIVDKNMRMVFYVSLDGYTAEQHDFIRGKGNFDKTIKFLKELKKHKDENNAEYKIIVNSLIHKKNYKDLISWYNFIDDLGLYGWRFTTGRVSGFLKCNVDEIKVNIHDCEKEFLKLIHFLIEKYKKGEDMLYVNVENLFSTKALKEKVMYIFDKNLNICDYKYNACSVDPKGNIQFCTGWQNIKYGNVFKENIEKIWLSPNLQKIKNMKVKDIKDCQDCKYLKYCGGGCRLECENIYAKDEAICDNFEIFEEKIIPILKENGIKFNI